MSQTFRIVAPHFVAGGDIDDETENVIKAAPIIKYMLGWHATQLTEYCWKKQWQLGWLDPQRTSPQPPKKPSGEASASDPSSQNDRKSRNSESTHD